MKYFLFVVFLNIFVLIPISNLNLNSDIEQFITKKRNDKNFSLKIKSELYADSILNTLTIEQRIAQLIMIDVYPKKEEKYYTEIENLVKEKKIGGIIQFKGSPKEMVKLNKRLSAVSEIPLWIAVDAEWGIAMRADSIKAFPKAMTLGALSDNNLIRQYGRYVGEQLKKMGFNMNMAPVADVNCNPQNPVINYRSFGENKKLVAEKSIEYYLGLNDAGVVAVAKHFPGHGDTETDSHHDLPIIKDDFARIDSIHLYPFKQLIKYDIPGIMIAHLYVEAIEKTPNLASSLSYEVVNNLLLQNLGFNGIVITDALNMKGVTKFFTPDEIELKALLAGNDILLMPANPSKTIENIMKAIQNNKITEEQINQKCRKLLQYKYIYLVSNNDSTVFSENPVTDFNNQAISDFNQEIFESAITLLKNTTNSFPLQNPDINKTLFVNIGKKGENYFIKEMQKHGNISVLNISSTPSDVDIQKIINEGKTKNKVIFSVYGLSNQPKKNYGTTTQLNKLFKDVCNKIPSGIIIYGNPYSLNHLPDANLAKSIVVAYEETPECEKAIARLITGETFFKGKLPVTLTHFKAGTGITEFKHSLLEYADTSELNINTRIFKSIDSLIDVSIKAKVFPGCQILLAKDGKIFFHKSYGYHTYDNTQIVRNSDLYDLASLTKILATTLAIMKLFDEGKIKLSNKISDFFEWTKNKPIANVTISDILTHQTGMVSWLPFYLDIIKNDSTRNKLISKKYSEEFSLQIADSMFLKASYKDSILMKIASRPLGRKRYLYSDMGFYFLSEIISKVTQMPFESYVEETFYKPLGLSTLTFNPLKKFSKEEIIPTEYDKEFRRQLIHGYVHDPGCALFGGVAGNAGLFGNAYDVACLMQLFLNEGKFGDKQYINSLTIKKFTAKQSNLSRRGLGFDRPENPPTKGNTCELVSQQSYGHTGFTGTFAWADPKYGLIVVFLSNRIHPDAENKKINSLEVRKKLQKLAYKAIQVK